MKKFILFIILGLSVFFTAQAQIITTNPALITNDYNGVIEIIYDATQGNAGLKDYSGAVYAHTGVISNLSTSDSDWKHAPTWGDNSPKYQLTSLGNNKWKLLITPNISGYYGLSTGEIVKKLAFVFRSEQLTNTDNTKYYKEGKDVGNTDILLNIYEPVVKAILITPTNKNKLVALNTTETIQIGSPVNADLELLVNGTSVKSAVSSTLLDYSITYSSATEYTLVAKATLGSVIKYDTAYVCVPLPVTTQTRPAGLKDGITYSADGTSATLIMYAPGKSNIFVIGDFNGWAIKNDFQMKKDGDYWWYTVTGLTPGKLYAFQYLVDGTIRIADAYTELILDPWNDKWINQSYNIYPNLPAYPTGKTSGLVGTLQSNKPAYAWEVTNFTMPPADNMVIYEMLLRDFTTERSLEAAIAKLDYLKTLGVTAVELMPIQEFDGNNSWGYNPNAYFAPDKAYGTPSMYKKFIDECHKRGMAVILDMVFNQANGLHPFALLYWDSANNRPASNNPWMNPVAPHQFSVLNDFNHSFTGTREYFKRVLQYWLTEYKVDGYRMDLTKGFTQSSGTESTFDTNRANYLIEYKNAVKATNTNAMFILEHFVGGTEEDYLAVKGMYLWRNMNNAYSQSAMGFQSGADFSGMNSSPRRWVGYAESHDEERNFYKAKEFGDGVIKTDEAVRIARVPLNIAFTTLMPGPKMIWQFGEMGYDYSINSFGGRTDPKPAVWEWLNVATRKAAYDKCAKIITLKKNYPAAFISGTYSTQVGGNDWNAGKRIALSHTDLNMVMVGNFYANSPAITNPNFPKTGTWYELLTGEELNVTNTTMTLQLNAGDVKIYTDKKVATGLDENVKKSIESAIYPTVTKGIIRITTAEPVTQARIFNTQGALQKTFNDTNEIDASELKAGMYLMEISTNQGKAVHKFIKQ